LSGFQINAFCASRFRCAAASLNIGLKNFERSPSLTYKFLLSEKQVSGSMDSCAGIRGEKRRNSHGGMLFHGLLFRAKNRGRCGRAELMVIDFRGDGPSGSAPSEVHSPSAGELKAVKAEIDSSLRVMTARRRPPALNPFYSNFCCSPCHNAMLVGPIPKVCPPLIDRRQPK